MSTPLSIAQILAAIQADFQAWTAPIKFSSVGIAKDPFHVLELLAQQATGARLIIGYAGTHPAGGEGPIQDNIGEHLLDIIVGYSLGLTAEPDAQLAKARADGRPALGTVIDAVRQRALGILWPDEITRQLAQHKATESVVTPDGIPLAAYRIRIGLIALLREPAADDLREAAISDARHIF